APAATPTPALQNLAAAASSPEFFEARVRPILAANCYDCHADGAQGGLRLDSRESMLKGGDSGPAIVPGKPDESLLIKAVKRLPGQPQMPNGRPKLKDDDIAALEDWIRAGAPWPVAAAKPAAPTGMVVTAEQRQWWSFVPLKVTTPPAVHDSAWPKTTVD